MLHKIQNRSSLEDIQPSDNTKVELNQISTLARHQRAHGPHPEVGRHSYNLRCAGVALVELSLWCWRFYTQRAAFFLRNLRAHKGGGRNLLASASPTSSIQEGGPLSCCAHCTGIGVSADQLQHPCRGPVVEGQLTGAVATHPDPHGPQQHSHAWHALVSRGCHRHVVVGLCLCKKKINNKKFEKGDWVRECQSEYWDYFTS